MRHKKKRTCGNKSIHNDKKLLVVGDFEETGTSEVSIVCLSLRIGRVRMYVFE